MLADAVVDIGYTLECDGHSYGWFSHLLFSMNFLKD